MQKWWSDEDKCPCASGGSTRYSREVTISSLGQGKVRNVKIAKWVVVTLTVIDGKTETKMINRSVIVLRRKRALEKEEILGKVVVKDVGEIM